MGTAFTAAAQRTLAVFGPRSETFAERTIARGPAPPCPRGDGPAPRRRPREPVRRARGGAWWA